MVKVVVSSLARSLRGRLITVRNKDVVVLREPNFKTTVVRIVGVAPYVSSNFRTCGCTLYSHGCGTGRHKQWKAPESPDETKAVVPVFPRVKTLPITIVGSGRACAFMTTTFSKEAQKIIQEKSS